MTVPRGAHAKLEPVGGFGVVEFGVGWIMTLRHGFTPRMTLRLRASPYRSRWQLQASPGSPEGRSGANGQSHLSSWTVFFDLEKTVQDLPIQSVPEPFEQARVKFGVSLETPGE